MRKRKREDSEGRGTGRKRGKRGKEEIRKKGSEPNKTKAKGEGKIYKTMKRKRYKGGEKQKSWEYADEE